MIMGYVKNLSYIWQETFGWNKTTECNECT